MDDTFRFPYATLKCFEKGGVNAAIEYALRFAKQPATPREAFEWLKRIRKTYRRETDA